MRKGVAERREYSCTECFMVRAGPRSAEMRRLYRAASCERGEADLVVGDVEHRVVRAHHDVAKNPEAHRRRALEAKVGLTAGRAENVVGRCQRECHRVAERDRDVLRRGAQAGRLSTHVRT